ncbi:hypothetical protein T03_6356 [Trichinella britovi]|uniref:Uncharacterized protein n=1 Tax=Trichinella britovi TaxID=45882 RepID=A0A0V1C5S7_TRIBR|nr:hypothetical protein T03_6356 [Trichinella britovi]
MTSGMLLKHTRGVLDHLCTGTNKKHNIVPCEMNSVVAVLSSKYMNGDQISVTVLSSLSKCLQEIFCTVKGPIPAPAVTLSQQPRIGGKYQYIIGRRMIH